MVCEFYNKVTNMCEAKKIVNIYMKESPRTVDRLPKGYKEKYCKTDNNRFCSRRWKLKEIIKNGDFDDG